MKLASGCPPLRTLACAAQRFRRYERRDVPYLSLAQLPLERRHSDPPTRDLFDGHRIGRLEVGEVDPFARPISGVERVAPRAGGEEDTIPGATVGARDRPNHGLRDGLRDRCRAASSRCRGAGTFPAHVGTKEGTRGGGHCDRQREPHLLLSIGETRLFVNPSQARVDASPSASRLESKTWRGERGLFAQCSVLSTLSIRVGSERPPATNPHEPHAAGRLIGESRVGDPEPSHADDVNPKESVRTG